VTANLSALCKEFAASAVATEGLTAYRLERGSKKLYPALLAGTGKKKAMLRVVPHPVLKQVPAAGRRTALEKLYAGFDSPQALHSCPHCDDVAKAMDPPVKRWVKANEGPLCDAIAAYFTKWRAKFAAQIAAAMKIDLRSLLHKDERSPSEIVDAILQQLDMEGFAIGLAEEVKASLLKAFKAGGINGYEVASIKADLEHVNDAALAYAGERAGELVGMKEIDGRWVENPNAEWAITETTRTGIRDLTALAVNEGWGQRELSRALDSSGVLSESRSNMIARTELATAFNEGNLNSWRDSGAVAGKESLLADTHPAPDECDDAADQGIIGIDELFLDEFDGPPYHPNCLCAMNAYTDEEMAAQEKFDKGDLPGHEFHGNQWTGGAGVMSNPNFRAWFGDSKVVNEDGTPKVLYHATPASFDVFKPGGLDPEVSGPAIWLTDSKERQNAAHHTGRYGNEKTGLNVMPLYARIEHPLELTTRQQVERAARRYAGDKKYPFPLIMDQHVVDKIRDAGYDGVIMHASAMNMAHEDRASFPTEYVVFHSSQLKSAIGNSGNYDVYSPNITKFDEDQPRDEKGRWTTVGYAGIGVSIRETPVRIHEKGRVTNAEVFQHLDNLHQQQVGRALDWHDKADMALATTAMANDLDYELAHDRSGLEWYGQTIRDAFSTTATIVPGIEKPENQVIFKQILALTSPGIRPEMQWEYAAICFEHYMKTGEIPGRNPDNGQLWPGGPSSANKETSLNMLNAMAQDKEHFPDTMALATWLSTEHTVSEINAVRQKYGGYSKSSNISGKMDSLRPGHDAWGEKVGPFMGNMNGSDNATVDVWAYRNFNRYMGTLSGTVKEAPTEPERRAIYSMYKSLGDARGLKVKQVQAELWNHEQKLYTALGAISKPSTYLDGAKAFVAYRTGTRVKGARKSDGDDDIGAAGGVGSTIAGNCETDLRALIRFDEGQHPRDDHGRFAPAGGTAHLKAKDTPPVIPAFAPTPPDKDLDLQRAELKSFENEHWQDPIEWAQAVNPAGGRLLGPKGVWGNATSISFTQQEHESVTNKDAVFTHNHPGRLMPLSREDIAFAMWHNLKEVRAVAGDKVYSLRRGPDGWPKLEHFIGQMNTERSALSYKYPAWGAWKAHGATNEGEASAMFQDAAIKRTVAAYPRGAIYEVFPR
jgi:hypothetical protein